MKWCLQRPHGCLIDLQIWDIGGQPRFRSMWERYCRGVNAIVWVFHRLKANNEWVLSYLTQCKFGFGIFLLIFSYMVDAADQEKVEASRNELHNLLDKPQLQGIPVSVLPTPLSFHLSHCAIGWFSITATSNLNSVAISGFGSRQQKGSSHCFRWKATHWENVSRRIGVNASAVVSKTNETLWSCCENGLFVVEGEGLSLGNWTVTLKTFRLPSVQNWRSLSDERSNILKITRTSPVAWTRPFYLKIFILFIFLNCCCLCLVHSARFSMYMFFGLFISCQNLLKKLCRLGVYLAPSSGKEV